MPASPATARLVSAKTTDDQRKLSKRLREESRCKIVHQCSVFSLPDTLESPVCSADTDRVEVLESGTDFDSNQIF